jgi:hypothetical protein
MRSQYVGPELDAILLANHDLALQLFTHEAATAALTEILLEPGWR